MNIIKRIKKEEDIYTWLLRTIAKSQRPASGHCDDSPSRGGGSGHCS